MNLLHLGHTIVRLDLVDSTNNYTANWLNRSIVAEGTVILARSQSHGKGQRGNSWASEPGQNLTFSIVLYPTFLQPLRAHLLTHVAALALYDVVKVYCNDTAIKWPNDVYGGNLKIAGILVENTIMENKIRHAIAGIGLNINQTEFPEGIQATSLKKITGELHDIEVVLQQLLRAFEKYYFMLATGKTDELHDLYLSRLYLRNITTNFTVNGVTVTGKITQVNSNGKLVIQTAEGELEAGFKEISFQN